MFMGSEKCLLPISRSWKTGDFYSYWISVSEFLIGWNLFIYIHLYLSIFYLSISIYLLIHLYLFILYLSVYVSTYRLLTVLFIFARNSNNNITSTLNTLNIQFTIFIYQPIKKYIVWNSPYHRIICPTI